MKRITMSLVALAAMLALTTPAMAQDGQPECGALSGAAQDQCYKQGAMQEFAGESNPSGIPSASASASSASSASASASASADTVASASASATASASASSATQYSASPSEATPAELPDTGGPSLLFLGSGAALLTGGLILRHLILRRR